MGELERTTELPEGFDGQVRLFPLPDLVVFPQAMQPLHLFEPRYCALLAEALAGDRLIAMATLAGEPSAAAAGIAPVVCIGRILSHVATEDDRHNVLLLGLQRARIRRYVGPDSPFPRAEVDVLHDRYAAAGAAGRGALKRRLLDAFGQLIPDGAEVQRNLHELMASQMALGPVTDILAFTLRFPAAEKLALLGEPDVDVRAAALVRLLEKHLAINASAEPEDRFPPPFSAN
jgi:uncharacterized protein